MMIFITHCPDTEQTGTARADLLSIILYRGGGPEGSTVGTISTKSASSCGERSRKGLITGDWTLESVCRDRNTLPSAILLRGKAEGPPSEVCLAIVNII